MTSPPPPSPPRRGFRLGLGAAVVLAIVVLSVAVGVELLRGRTSTADAVPLIPTSSAASAAPEAELYVHVLGAVERPGLYVLHPGARVVDALAAAGGTVDGADLAAVNLARPVEDGEQVVVPVAGAPAGPSAVPSDGGAVDLNSADQAALEALPGIGPALAERILAWREENGRFRSVDDLLAVPGIGEKLLEGLRDGVRV